MEPVAEHPWAADDRSRATRPGLTSALVLARVRLPLAEWFRGELRALARDALLDPHTRECGFFRPQYVRALLDRHADGVQDHSQGIWTLLMFELWHQEFVDVAPREPTARPRAS